MAVEQPKPTAFLNRTWVLRRLRKHGCAQHGPSHGSRRVVAPRHQPRAASAAGALQRRAAWPGTQQCGTTTFRGSRSSTATAIDGATLATSCNAVSGTASKQLDVVAWFVNDRRSFELEGWHGGAATLCLRSRSHWPEHFQHKVAPMPKRGQFLLIVQTAVLANGVSLASQPELAETYRDEYSAAGVLELMAEAVAAGERIPDEMGGAQAAAEFCQYKLRHLRDARHAAGTPVLLPEWLADE